MTKLHMPRSAVALVWLTACAVLAGLTTRAEAGIVCVGNVVFRDANGNGKYDSGEGVGNVEVQLFASGTDPSTGTPVRTTFTTGTGSYLYYFLDDGDYFIHIPASEFQLGGDLANHYSIPGNAGAGADDDVGEDGLDDATPALNGISTADFVVMVNNSPTLATGETGFDSQWDDFDDANIDLTVDLGFYKPVGVGNLVFADTNQNGHADPGEGVPGVIVRLFLDGSDPVSDNPISEVTTDTQGEFLFSDIGEGSYFIHVPASEFASGRPLYGATSLAGISASADDDVGDDTVDGGSAEIDGVSTRVFALAAGQAPTDNDTETGISATMDNFADADVDMTVDVGFSLPLNSVGVGNYVFVDSNGNGHGDLNEGVDEVVVRLFLAGDDPLDAAPQAEQVTADGGHYYFGNLEPGSYFVHIPGSQFGISAPLQGMVSLPGADNGFYDDDTGEDGVDPTLPIDQVGIRTPAFTLTPGTEPTGGTSETGDAAYSDDFSDASIDLTMDFGFRLEVATTMGVGNVVFVDANNNGRYDGGEGIGGVTVQIFLAGENPQAAAPIDEVVTSPTGSYAFYNLEGGSFAYFVHVPKTQFMIGGPLHGMDSVPGNGQDDGIDDDADENGIDDVDLDLYGLSTIDFTLGNNQEPVDGGTETGFGATSDNTDDNNVDLTIDIGFRSASAPQLAVGNLVFFDANNNGKADVGEGVDGVSVLLFQDGQNPLSDTPLQTAETANGGQYLFSGLLEGQYFAYIPNTEFEAAGQLFGKTSMAGSGSDSGFDDDINEDGLDASAPETTGVMSHSFNLQSNLEPVNAGNEKGLFATMDDADDNNGDMTIDFGFSLSCPTITILPGSLSNGATGSSYSVTFMAEGGQAPYSWSKSGTLPPGLSLATTGELTGTPTNAGTWSFGVRAIDSAGCSTVRNYSLTIDQSMKVGNLVYVDSNWNGSFDSGEGLNGVDVQLFRSGDTPGSNPPVSSTTTAAGGFYLLSGLPTGDYFLHVPATMFQPGGPLAGKVSRTGFAPSTDDDYGEDGQDAADPASTGVSTDVFTLANNSAPTDGTYETGQQGTSDNADDANGDLTRDFAFRNPEHPSTFSAWQSLNPLGGSNGPGDNPDGDGSANLIEYATLLPAASGLNGASAFRLTHTLVPFRFDAVFSRRVGGLQDVVFTLEGTTDSTLAPASWQSLTLAPQVTSNSDGSEKVTFSNLASDPVFQAAGSGFVRLKIELDANHDQVMEATAYSAAWAWAGVPFQALPQTLSLPVTNTDVFTGLVTSVSGNTLDVTGSVGTGNLVTALQAGLEYYVEITDGAHEGHRFEVTEASCTATTIVLDPAHARSTQAAVPSDLAGAPIVLRKHWRAKDALPVGAFRATNNSSTADRLFFYDPSTGAFKILWLFLNGGNAKWVLLGDASLADSGGRVINATEGLFVNARTTATTVPVQGVVRRNDCACPLLAGMNFIGAFWSRTQSAADRLMTVANGFAGSTVQSNADKIRIWNGDTSSTQSYIGYYLLKTASLERWVREGDAGLSSQSATQLFSAYRAAFIQARSARPSWKPLSPVSP
jgi:SdrD B-like domain/Putative Ig domain